VISPPIYFFLAPHLVSRVDVVDFASANQRGWPGSRGQARLSPLTARRKSFASKTPCFFASAMHSGKRMARFEKSQFPSRREAKLVLGAGHSEAKKHGSARRGGFFAEA